MRKPRDGLGGGGTGKVRKGDAHDGNGRAENRWLLGGEVESSGKGQGDAERARAKVAGAC